MSSRVYKALLYRCHWILIQHLRSWHTQVKRPWSVMKWIRVVVQIIWISVKINTKPILKINHKLNSIEVKKGQIHRELRDFLRNLWNSIKLDNEIRWEIKGFDKFGKRTQRRIHLIKIHWIWIMICGEIDKRIKEKFPNKKIAKNLN